MSKLTIKFELSAGQISQYSNSFTKPYQNLLDEITKKLPGTMHFVSDKVVSLAYSLYTIYEVTCENFWFVVDYEVQPIYDNVWLDDGNGSRYEVVFLSDLKFTKTGTTSLNSYTGSNNSVYNYGGTSNNFRNPVCNHIAVDVGFNIKNMQCKNCGKDMNDEKK
jgi:hypothetical protein